MPLDPCPACGAGRPDGLCPHCSTDREKTGRPDGPGSAPGTIGVTVADGPRVRLRDDSTIEDDGPPIDGAANGHDPSIRYRIEGRIAQGGMGAIFKGHDPDPGREVARSRSRCSARIAAMMMR